MGIKLTCPGCHDVLEAVEAERGKTIKCNTCWSDVAVPPPTAPIVKAAPLPTAKPLPAPGVPTAKPLADANTSGPKRAIPLPAAATPSGRPAEPTQAKRRDGGKDSDVPKKPRFKERDRRYDDDDDGPRRNEKKLGGAGLLIAFLALGAVIFLGMVGAIVVLVLNTQESAQSSDLTDPTSATVSAPDGTPFPIPPRNPGDFDPGLPNVPSPNLNPNPIPQPPPPPPLGGNPFGHAEPKETRPITQPWKPLDNKDGLSVDMPPGAKKERHLLELERNTGLVSGKKWVTDDGDVLYHVYIHDLTTDQSEMDLKLVAAPLVRTVHAYELNSHEVTKVDGKPAVRWELRHIHGGITHGVSARVGSRVFTLFCTSKRGLFPAADATLIEREEKFLGSVKISFDPKTHDLYADEPAWVPMAKTIGFTALIPRQSITPAVEFNPFFGFDVPVGKEWKAEVDGITYQMFTIDFAKQKRSNFNTVLKTPADLVKWFTDREKVVEGPDAKARLGTLQAEGYILKMFFEPQKSHVRFLSSGTMLYVAKTGRYEQFGKGCGDREFLDKTARFFASFRLGEGVIAPGPGGPVEPSAGGTGEFARVADARVLPFWTGCFLSQKKEFITFGVKDPNARPAVKGVVRRYSVPEFKLKATYETASPINRVAVDEAHGRLFAVTVRDAEAAMNPEKDMLITSGEVQQYDLAKLTDGSTGEGELLRPVQVLNGYSTTFKVSGLEVTSDGSAVYVSGVVIGGTKAKPTYRGGRLMKWDVASGNFATDISTDQPAWALAVSADGKKVVALEKSLDPARPGGGLVILDGPGWKRTGSVPLTVTPNDLSVRNDRAAVVANVSPGVGKVLVGPLDRDLAETDAGMEVSYLRFTPGGTKLLVAAGGQQIGLTLYNVTAGPSPRLTKTAFSGELGGLFVLAPDGRFAVMNVGAVLDLENSKVK